MSSTSFLKDPQYSSLRTLGVLVVFAFLGIFIFTHGVNQNTDDYTARVYKNPNIISVASQERLQAVRFIVAEEDKGCFVRFTNGNIILVSPCPFNPAKKISVADRTVDPMSIAGIYDWNNVPMVAAAVKIVSVKGAVPGGCFVTLTAGKIDSTRFVTVCPFDFSEVE